jgi:hypothetical protein
MGYTHVVAATVQQQVRNQGLGFKVFILPQVHQQAAACQI